MKKKNPPSADIKTNMIYKKRRKNTNERITIPTDIHIPNSI